MTDPRCEEVRLRLELGEETGLAGHLEGCEGCRAEAPRIRRLVGCLALDARLEPPRSLDRRVRTLLAAEPFGVLLHPWFAGALTAASFVALVSTLAVVLAATPAAEYGPLLAVALGLGYLALSAVAALPIMMHALNRQTRATGGRT